MIKPIVDVIAHPSERAQAYAEQEERDAASAVARMARDARRDAMADIAEADRQARVTFGKRRAQ